MLDLACIFTTGGVILFCRTFCMLKFDVLDQLVKKVLIQDKTAESSFHANPYVVKWRFANNINLIFAVIYQEMIQLPYVDEFLDMFRDNYVNSAVPELVIERNIYRKIPDFDEKFLSVYEQWQKKQVILEKKNSIMRTFDQTKKGKDLKKKTTSEILPVKPEPKSVKETPKEQEVKSGGVKSEEEINSNAKNLEMEEVKRNRELLGIPYKNEINFFFFS